MIQKISRRKGPLPIFESSGRLDEPPTFNAGTAVQMPFEKTGPTPGATQIKTISIQTDITPVELRKRREIRWENSTTRRR